MHGLTPDGEIFPFAENNVVITPELRDAKGYSGTDFTGSEWCGATFDPRGSWLLVNIQSPGFTAPITAPSHRGGLGGLARPGPARPCQAWRGRKRAGMGKRGDG